MAKMQLHYTITATFANKRAMRAMGCAARFIAEQAAGQEWNADAQRALKAVRYAMKHLRLTAKPDDEGWKAE